MSVLSMLAEPNVESGANVEVSRVGWGDGKEWRMKADQWVWAGGSVL